MTLILPVCAGTTAMQGKTYFNCVRPYSGGHATIVLADTLDTHNMISDPDDAELAHLAHDVALSGGDRWLRKHLPPLQDMFQTLNVIRWNEIRNTPGFIDKHRIAQDSFYQNVDYREYVTSICRHYVDQKRHRIYAQGHIPDVQLLFTQSLNYMIEEIAGTAIYTALLGGAAVYPGLYFERPDIINDLLDRNDFTIPIHLNAGNDDRRGAA